MGIRKATVVSILKKDGVVSARCRSRQRLTGKKRGLVFADDQQINVVREFDEELPVVAVAKPYNYEEGSYKQYDHICEGDDDDEVYWWEEEEEILPWYEMEDETELRSYQWDDVTDKAHAKYRTSAMDGLVDVEMAWEEYEVADDDKYADDEHGGDDDGDGDDDSSTSSGSSSGSSSSSSSSSSASSYEDVTVSDDDDAYQLKGNTVQLDIAHLAAVKSEAEGDPNKASVVAANPIKSPVASSQTTPKAVAGKVSVPIVRGGKQSPTPAAAAPKSPATPTDGSKPSPARVRPKRTSRSNSFKSVKRDEDLDTSDKSQPSPGSTKASSTPLVSSPAPAPAPAKASRNPVRRVATTPARRPSADSKAIASDRRSSLDDSATDNMTDYSTKSENGTRATAPEKQGGKASPRSSIKAIRDLKEMKLAKKKKESTSAPAHASNIPTIATSIANDPAVKVVKKKKHHHKTKRHHSTESGKSNKSGSSKKEKGRRSSLTKNNNKEKEEVYKQSDAEYLNKYTWEKPDWTNENKLKQTKKGRAVRKGANLARPITMINRAMNDMADAKRMRNMSSFGKPEWTKKSSILKKTDTGEQLGTGANLARKITHIASDASRDGKLGWEKPDWAKKKPVKPTPQGQKVQKGQNLAKGITNDVEVKEKYQWEKPSWAKKGPKLKSTEKGQKLKDGDSLAKPITFPKGKK